MKKLRLGKLPNPFEEVDVEKLSEKANGYAYYGKPLGEKYLAFKEGFIEGYKATQQSKQFSLEDMKKAIDRAYCIGYSDKKINEHCHLGIKREEEIIQSLSNQQLPQSFIPEYIGGGEYLAGEIGGNEIWAEYPKELKTITNSEGKQEIKGHYIW